MDKEYVLSEIRRTAEENGGRPLGRQRFESETGIRQHDWLGRYWARWSEALEEAGFPPNVLQARYDDERVIGALVSAIQQLGRMPTTAELKLRRREDPEFPSVGVFERLGPKAEWPTKVAEFCRDRPNTEDVLAIVSPLIVEAPVDEPEQPPPPASGPKGFVYMLKSGRHYKIGHTLDVGRRRYDLAIQLPDPVIEVHVIATDDPPGIERYWHGRFGDRRKNGEWFELTREDVAAFKRRKFM